ENHNAVLAEIGAKVDQFANVVPALLAETLVRCRDMEAFGRDHKPVQAYKGQSFRFNDFEIFPAIGLRDIGRLFREGKRSYFNSLVADGSDATANVGERTSPIHFITNCVTEKSDQLTSLTANWLQMALFLCISKGGRVVVDRARA